MNTLSERSCCLQIPSATVRHHHPNRADGLAPEAHPIPSTALCLLHIFPAIFTAREFESPPLPPLTRVAALPRNFRILRLACYIHMPLWPEYSPPPPLHHLAIFSCPVVGSITPACKSSIKHRDDHPQLVPIQQNVIEPPESRRASEDVYSPRASLSTPRSSTQYLFEECFR